MHGPKRGAGGGRPMIHIKRAYDRPSPEDVFRIPVERFWPRDLDEKHTKIGL